MKKTLLLAGVAGTLFALNANAAGLSPYVGIKAVYTDVDANLAYSDEGVSEKYNIGDKGLGGALAIGAKADLPYGSIRAELEYSKKADSKKSYTEFYGDKYSTKIETQTYMINAYYDFDTGTKITPYVMGGIGYAKLKAKDQYWSEEYGKSLLNKTKFAWQIGAGASYNINNHLSVDAGYRYIDYGNAAASETVDLGGDEFETEKLDIKSANEIYLGMRYNF